MINSRTTAGSLVSYANRRARSSDRTLTRSCTGTFEVRPHTAQHSNSQTSRSLPFALTRNLPEGWWRAPEQSMQGFTTTGRPHWRTAQSALRSIFIDMADSRLQRELSRARPRLRDLAGVHTRARSLHRSRVVRLRPRSRERSTAGTWQRHRSMRRIVSEAVSLRQVVFRLPRDWPITGGACTHQALCQH